MTRFLMRFCLVLFIVVSVGIIVFEIAFRPLYHGRIPDANDVVRESLVYLTITLAVFFLVGVWIYYHWRDLRMLNAAAIAFAEGSVSTRAQIPDKSSISPLAIKFNEMAGRIEALMRHQHDMMNGISHELKTPIARLEFGLALLDSNDGPQRLEERKAALQKDFRELNYLVTELLTLSRFEQGAAEVTLMNVSVSELLDSIAAEISSDVADRLLSLRIDYSNGPSHHVCDPTLVARAILHLIRNSARYAVSEISVLAQTERDGTLTLMVEDDGPGIPDEERARIFEPFYRLDHSRDRHTGGFGLGLAIVRRIALVHGGNAYLEDAAKSGARFVIMLPRRDALSEPLVRPDIPKRVIG